MTYEEMTIEQLKAAIKKLDEAIKKHREYVAWGNVEARQRVRELRFYKKHVQNLIKEKEEVHDVAEEHGVEL